MKGVPELEPCGLIVRQSILEYMGRQTPSRTLNHTLHHDIMEKMSTSSDGENEEEQFFDAQNTNYAATTPQRAVAARVCAGVEDLHPVQSNSRRQRELCAPTKLTSARSRSQSRPRRPSAAGVAGCEGGRKSTREDARRSLDLTTTLPEVPPIPKRFLAAGRPASLSSFSRREPAPAQGRPTTLTPPASSARPSTSAGERQSTSQSAFLAQPAPPTTLKRTTSLNSRERGSSNASLGAKRIPKPRLQPPELKRTPSPVSPKPKPVVVKDVRTLQALENRAPPSEGPSKMARVGRSRNQDLFLEIAEDNNNTMSQHDDITPLRRSESRASYAGKRRSLPVDAMSTNDRRPNTSGNIYTRPTSRMHSNRASTDLQRHLDQYRSTPNRGSVQFGESASVTGISTSGRSRRFSVMPDRSPASPSRFNERVKSPELPEYGRRRPSFGTSPSIARQREFAQSTTQTFYSLDESPAESSEPKQGDSTSADSETADTVWDELDDLKSRIKKLELTGKMPESSTAVSGGGSSDRPRTATTAPTTIESSPKQERKQEPEEKAAPTPPPQTESTVTSNPTANVHPTLHSALAKAKPLLNGSLFRTLEATANDALQLAAMTGSAGPQGTAYSAASIINGVTVSDRHVRRKADNMCRNLTDLCLALCEGKHEAPNVLSSPASGNTMMPESPPLRYAPVEDDQPVGRPMSVLESRRASILGIPPSGSFESISPRGSVADISPNELETPTHSYSQPPRRVSRAPSSIVNYRAQRQDELSGDDDPTIRPASRAMTDIGSLRARPRASLDRSPGAQRTPNMRESLTARRNNDAAFEYNREPSRVNSFGSDSRRRRFLDHQSTPPIEEGSPSEYASYPDPRRRILSSNQYSGRRTTADGRSPSLSQQRRQLVE